MKFTRSKKFKKKFKKYCQNKKFYNNFLEFLLFLKNSQKIPKKFQDHKLIGKYKNYREVHILPDLCLIYREIPEENCIILRDLDSHSNLFK